MITEIIGTWMLMFGVFYIIGDSANTGSAHISDIGKWISIVGMLLGRLEIFTLLVLITPTFWRT